VQRVVEFGAGSVEWVCIRWFGGRCVSALCGF